MVQGKLTRKEIVQQDIFRKTLTSISGWLVKNRVYFFGAIAAFIMVVGIAYLVQQFLSSRAEEMQSEFSDALAVYHAPVDSDQPDSPQNPSQQFPTKYRFTTETERYETALTRFQDLATRQEGNRIGYFATYYSGLSLLELNRGSEAKTLFEEVNTDSVDTDLRNLARNSLAQLAMSSSDFEGAIQLFEQILNEPSRNLPEQIVLIRLGNALEKTDQLEKALEHYRKVTIDFAGTAAASEAQEKIRRIEPKITTETPAEESLEPGADETEAEK